MPSLHLLLLGPAASRTAPAHRAPGAGMEPGFLLHLWESLGLWARIIVMGLGGIALVVAAVWGFRQLSRGRWRRLLGGFTGLCFGGAVVLGTWAMRLPTPKGTYFVFWHQIVRVGAVLTGMGFVLGGLALVIPKIFDRFEGKSFVSFIAARHVRSQKSGFLTVISVLSISGVAVSSLALCLVVAVMGGFGADLKRKILGNNAHVKIEAKTGGGFGSFRDLLDDVRKRPGVKAATPVAAGEAMASSSSNTAGVILRGIDPETIGSVIELVKNIEVGRFGYITDWTKLRNLPPDEPIGLGPGGEVYLKGPDLKYFDDDKALDGGTPKDKPADEVDPAVKEAMVPVDAYPGIVLGRELAKTLHVYIGDELTLVSPLGDLGPMGVLPKSRRFRVAAIFYSGMYEYDSSQAYVVLDVAQDFLDLPGKVTALEIRAEDAERVGDVRPGLLSAIQDRDDLRVRDWKESNRNLFSALQLEKIATFVILSLAILVASFCIICTLLLMVTEKSKEIAVMKSLGASDQAILRIFMVEGMMIGGIGTVLGVLTGLSAALGLLWFGVRLDPDVYYIDRLPISVDPLDFLIVAVSALAITTLATLYPALAASRLRPVDGIRYE
ncbi:MAG TPA: FtsX-like permease family protein [Polyangiaceae bacterium]|nr:FtsX-like permease family protein [Polyangiaceae bacterium]